MMRRRFASTLFTLCIALSQASPAASGPTITIDDYNAARLFGYRYFIRYREKFGVDMRLSAMLKACDFTEFAKQLRGRDPDIRDFAVQQFTNDDEGGARYDAKRKDMLFYVLLVSQSLAEAYELGFQEAVKGEFQRSNGCSALPKVYEKRLRELGGATK